MAASLFSAWAAARLGLLELIQPLFGRERSLDDMLANAVGVGLGILIGLILRKSSSGHEGRTQTRRSDPATSAKASDIIRSLLTEIRLAQEESSLAI